MASRCLGFPWFMQDRELSCSITRNDAWSLHTPSVSVFHLFISFYVSHTFPIHPVQISNKEPFFKANMGELLWMVAKAAPREMVESL